MTPENIVTEKAIHVIVQVNPSCCIKVRTSFRYKINLAKVLSKPRSHTHFGTKQASEWT